MAMGDGVPRSMEETPTWAVALVCLVFVLISIFIEYIIHLLSQMFRRRRKVALNEALEKIKAELMLLGFLSLLLTVGQQPIGMICVSKSLGNTMLPCPNKYAPKNTIKSSTLVFATQPPPHLDGFLPPRRLLAGGGATSGPGHCEKKGLAPLISQTAISQLHYFIFVLAVFHVFYSVLTMVLAKLKMKKWQIWENEVMSLEYQYMYDGNRFRLLRETSFGRRHNKHCTKNPIMVWIVCFFRQFFSSVHRVDYITLRHGFIQAHLAPNSKFNFQKYIVRSLEEDFKTVVGISIPIWMFAVVFLLLNAHGWISVFWLSFIPVVVVLAVGTKLQVIVTKMALEVGFNKSAIVEGIPIVHPDDKLFWFNRPRWVLYIIHFTLFQNAFQLAFFFWSLYEFGMKSCYHERKIDVISRLTTGVAVHLLCSYVTLPLYALVTQMGSNMKSTVFEPRAANALKKWHKEAKKKVRKTRPAGYSGSTSPLHLLSVSSPHIGRGYHSDGDIPQISPELSAIHPEPPSDEEKPHHDSSTHSDFSFSK